MTATANAEAPPLLAGEVLIPGYVVLQHICRGETLDTYEVFSEERECSCVAKTLRPSSADHERRRQRLRREGELATRLTHPHIVRGYETIEEPRLVIILEAIGGVVLDRMIDTRRRRLSALDLCWLGVHLCRATGYLHRHGILHLDLKPGNIVAEAGRAKVIDLSLARPPGECPPGLGTAAYFSPEQARGEFVTTASDVWGIGAVLYEAATATTPFKAPDDNEAYEQTERRAHSVSAHRRLPRSLAAAVNRCLEPRPDERPSVAELGRMLAPERALTTP